MKTYTARYAGSETEDGGEETIRAPSPSAALAQAKRSAKRGDWVPGEKVKIIISEGEDDLCSGSIPITSS